MATIEPVDNSQVGLFPKRYRFVTWEQINQDDEGGTILMDPPSQTDRTVQMVGTFNGGTYTLEGSLDGTNFFPLTDPAGNAIALTTVGGRFVVENVLYYRVSNDNAGTSEDVDVHLLFVE